MKMYPSNLAILEKTLSALVAADFSDVCLNFEPPPKGTPPSSRGRGIRTVVSISAGPEDRRAEFERIIGSYDPDARAA